MEEPAPTIKSFLREIASASVKHWSVLAALVTGLGYGLGRWFYDSLCGSLGFSPEDAGLGQIDVLVRLFPALCLVLFFLGFIILATICAFLSEKITRIVWLLVAGVSVLLLGGWGLVVTDPGPRGELASGQEPPLMNAVCVEVHWLTSVPENDPLQAKSTMWFFGSREGIGVFVAYEPQGQRTVRLPLSNLSLLSAENSSCGK